MLKPVFCGRDCGGDACPLLAEVEGGRVTKIHHNPAAGPYLRGCPKGFALPHFHYSPERLRTPLLRIGPRGSGLFRPAGWDEALDRVREGLSACRERHGDNSILCLSSAGSTGALHNTETLTRRFLNATGGCTVLDGSYSCGAAGFALKKAFGRDFGESGFDPATVEKAAMIVLWGANVLEARLGAELPARLAGASNRGVPIVSIDPRRTSTSARLGAEWIPIRPGKDAALMYAILHELNRAGLIDQDYVERRSTGFREIIAYIEGSPDGVEKSPSWAEGICGVGAAVIVDLARRWASAKPVMLIPGYSIQRTDAGEEAARLCVALQLATQNFGLAGGSSGSLNNRLPGPRVGRLGEGMGAGNPGIPILRWADAVLGNEPACPTRIGAVYSAGGNFLNQGADIGKNARAFQTLDFAVCHELFMTPTAQYCDIVLPAASPLQKEDIGLPWAGNYLLYKPRILPCEGQERSDYDIFSELASRFGAEREFTEGRSDKEWIDHFLASSEIDDVEEFKSRGVYFGAEQERTGLEAFAADPEEKPLRTSSGKVELAGPRWTGWGGRPHQARGVHPAGGTDCGESPPAPWLLVTPKAALRVHSQGGDHPDEIIGNSLAMNAADAGGLGIKAGDLVELSSETGSLVAAVSPTENIMHGVVSLYEGTWFSAPGAEGFMSGSANSLTSTRGTDESTSCVMHGILVGIKKLEPAAPRGTEAH